MSSLGHLRVWTFGVATVIYMYKLMAVAETRAVFEMQQAPECEAKNLLRKINSSRMLKANQRAVELAKWYRKECHTCRTWHLLWPRPFKLTEVERQLLQWDDRSLSPS